MAKPNEQKLFVRNTPPTQTCRVREPRFFFCFKTQQTITNLPRVCDLLHENTAVFYLTVFALNAN